MQTVIRLYHVDDLEAHESSVDKATPFFQFKCLGEWTPPSRGKTWRVDPPKGLIRTMDHTNYEKYMGHLWVHRVLCTTVTEKKTPNEHAEFPSAFETIFQVVVGNRPDLLAAEQLRLEAELEGDADPEGTEALKGSLEEFESVMHTVAKKARMTTAELVAAVKGKPVHASARVKKERDALFRKEAARFFNVPAEAVTDEQIGMTRLRLYLQMYGSKVPQMPDLSPEKAREIMDKFLHAFPNLEEAAMLAAAIQERESRGPLDPNHPENQTDYEDNPHEPPSHARIVEAQAKAFKAITGENLKDSVAPLRWSMPEWMKPFAGTDLLYYMSVELIENGLNAPDRVAIEKGWKPPPSLQAKVNLLEDLYAAKLLVTPHEIGTKPGKWVETARDLLNRANTIVKVRRNHLAREVQDKDRDADSVDAVKLAMLRDLANQIDKFLWPGLPQEDEATVTVPSGPGSNYEKQATAAMVSQSLVAETMQTFQRSVHEMGMKSKVDLLHDSMIVEIAPGEEHRIGSLMAAIVWPAGYKPVTLKTVTTTDRDVAEVRKALKEVGLDWPVSLSDPAQGRQLPLVEYDPDNIEGVKKLDNIVASWPTPILVRAKEA